MAAKFLTVFLTLLAVAAAEVAVFRRCDKVSQDPCTITELRITPCRKSPCVLKKGRNASLEFDFTPNFATSKLKTAVYWADDPTEAPFATVGIADGCQHATCPTVVGTQNTLTYSLYVGKKLPNGKFWFRWKLWNDENPEQLCCFETNVELKK
ncbi:unnamed protein product [Chilo suppressalis]|uniref:MD-2-related lipid-recognition domain-containing protein n=1 Tax=Chilo suppressalis TaxID=168631 RepID=A0ABN8EAX3_CHISP|nr:unnamed protein product [Chilo suppressalis]